VRALGRKWSIRSSLPSNPRRSGNPDSRGIGDTAGVGFGTRNVGETPSLPPRRPVRSVLQMPGDIAIRQAREDERVVLGALKLRASLGWGDMIEEILALPGAATLEAEMSASFVAEIGGRTVGFATVLSKDAQGAEMEDLFVEPDEWRKGVGRRLMAEAERRALGVGARRLQVAANPRAQRFYEACGFQVIGQVREAFGWSPLMEKQLS
jgi:GNAT superfamily N-acetyltransferase